MAAGWVGSVLSWAGLGTNGSGKLSGAAEDEPTKAAPKPAEKQA